MINATQMAFGAMQLPDAIWSQLPPGAQSAITAHNGLQGSGTNTQARTMQTQMHNPAQAAHMLNQMSSATQQIYGSTTPVQVNTLGQTPGTLPTPPTQ